MKHSLTLIAVLAVAFLAGCDTVPREQTALIATPVNADQSLSKYGTCTMAVNADAGNGVRVDRCVSWAFGPNRMQDYRFRHNLGIASWGVR